MALHCACSRNHSEHPLNKPVTGNKPPVFPKAAPRTKSQKLRPITAADTSPQQQQQYQQQQPPNRQTFTKNNNQSAPSPHRNQVRGPTPQGYSNQGQTHTQGHPQGQRLGSGQQHPPPPRYAGLPNGAVQNGFTDKQGLPNRGLAQVKTEGSDW